MLMWTSFAKRHLEDTGAASWKVATFNMEEETDIVKEGLGKWFRTISIRTRRTETLGSITGEFV
jgi:hypothetical protein